VTVALDTAALSERLPQFDRSAWQTWLESQLDPAWRPGEWDAEHWFFDGDPDNPRTQASLCAVQRCRTKTDGAPLCSFCAKKWSHSGTDLDVFAAEHDPCRTKRHPAHAGVLCQVSRDGVGCARPNHCRGLCRTHYSVWQQVNYRNKDRALSDWLARIPRPLPPDDRVCLVPRCETHADLSDGLCSYHHDQHGKSARSTPVAEWAATAAPYLTAGQFSLAVLKPLVRIELLFALQQRDAAGGAIGPKYLRRIVRAVVDRDHLVGVTREELAPADGRNTDLDSFRRDIVYRLRAGYEQMTGIEPTQRLVWDYRSLDIRGTVTTQSRRTHAGVADFTVISQHWLRDLTMERCRSYTTSRKINELLVAAEVASLALQATNDGGHRLTTLGPVHLEAITNGFRSWAHPDGRPRSNTRRYIGLEAVFSLIDFGRRIGLMEGVTNAFLRDPSAHYLNLDRPAPDEVGKAIPEPVIKQLDAHLPSLRCMADYPDWNEDQRQQMIQTIYVVMRDSGRRPREVCSLHAECLEFDKDGALLIWDNHKAGRTRRRLPITAQTADAITVWQQARQELRSGDRRDDYLFPAGAAERIDPYFRPAGLSRSLRAWVASIPEIMSDAVDAKGRRMPFDRALIHPYAFRHSYAQRHADAGVPIDVLRDLMDHRQISTTQTYYRVTLKRKREAVQTLRLLVADRHGMATPTTSNTAYEMRSVAAPFGNCVEPSNVKAGGGSCPIRFQCSGCGFYRPDPSYLPAIEDHIRALRADRETASAMDVDEFVLRNLADQIAAYQQVVDAMNARLAALPADQQHEVQQASALLRRVRAGAAASPVRLTVSPKSVGATDER
jgi:integrase